MRPKVSHVVGVRRAAVGAPTGVNASGIALGEHLREVRPRVERHHPLDQGGVDALAPAAALALVQREQRALEGEERGGERGAERCRHHRLAGAASARCCPTSSPTWPSPRLRSP